MEQWDLLKIKLSSHDIKIESTDATEVSFVNTHLREMFNLTGKRMDMISRDKHVAEISLYDVATDDITENMRSKKDRPYERDIYWQLLVLIRTRGWMPFNSEGLFIRHT